MHRSLEFRSVSVRVMCVAKQSVTKIYSLKQKQRKKKEDNIFHKEVSL